MIEVTIQLDLTTGQVRLNWPQDKPCMAADLCESAAKTIRKQAVQQELAGGAPRIIVPNGPVNGAKLRA